MNTRRDYAADMRTMIDKETVHTPYSSPAVAERIVKKLRETDPDLLTGWLEAQAVNIIRHAINLRDASARSHARATAGRSVFYAAAQAYEAGDKTAMKRWLDTVHVVENGTRVRLADMKAADLDFVADSYSSRASDFLLQEAFLRAVARKVGKRKVSDVFDDDKLTQLWSSILER